MLITFLPVSNSFIFFVDFVNALHFFSYISATTKVKSLQYNNDCPLEESNTRIRMKRGKREWNFCRKKKNCITMKFFHKKKENRFLSEKNGVLLTVKGRTNCFGYFLLLFSITQISKKNYGWYSCK